ncbi:MAG: hypothetical protein CSA13_00765 [Clostridiales bacterium]|nr:MAG: hypothetical protein CSA13_00765 [Clostridiales bacterium]
MKQMKFSKKALALLLTLALVVGLVPAGIFKSYATNDFEVDLSTNGGVKATYDDAAKTLTISGSGTIEYDKWVAMARTFNEYYYYDSYLFGWHDNITEDFDIVFDGDADHAIKLCGKEGRGGLFSGFSGAISFAKKVDLAATATDLSYMFFKAPQFNQAIDHWNVANVTDMRDMFAGATNFNGEIGAWNVANVTDMDSMFNGAASFNGEIGSWNVGSVTNMRHMFEDATAFNQPLNGWNVSNVTDMIRMFFGATAFNQPLDSWNVANVTSMSEMFRRARSFNGEIGSWNVGSVTNMSYMFYDAEDFNGKIGAWDVANVTDMYGMFNGAASFNGEIGGWNAGSVTDMGSMFSGATAFNQPISSWDVSKVTNMGYMFNGAASYNQPIELDISSLKDDVSTDWYVEGLKGAFWYCATPSIILNAGSNTDIDATDAFVNATNLSYLEFSGLTGAEIAGFSGDYIVENRTANTTTTCAFNVPYNFDNNAHYIVYTVGNAPLTLSDSVKTYQVGDTATESIDIAKIMPADAGAITTTLGAITGDAAILADGADAPKVSGNVLTYTLSGSGSAGAMATLPLTVGSAKYKDASLNVVVKLLDAPKKPLSDCTINPIADQTYTGSAIEPQVTVYDGVKKLQRGTDYRLNYTNNINVGTATVTLTGQGDYTGTVTRNFQIVAPPAGKKLLSDCTINPIVDQTYTGSAIEPQVTVYDGVKKLQRGTDYRLNYTNNINVGTATVTLTGQGDYTGTVTRNFQIVAPPAGKKLLSDCTINPIVDQTYTGSPLTPAVVIKDGSYQLVKDTDYTLSYRTNTAVGTGVVIITGQGNYHGQVEKQFTIVAAGTAKKQLANCTIKPIANQTYTGSALTPAVVIKDGAKTLVKDTDYTLSYQDNIAIGTATVTATGRGDYSGVLTENFAIVAAPPQGGGDDDNDDDDDDADDNSRSSKSKPGKKSVIVQNPKAEADEPSDKPADKPVQKAVFNDVDTNDWFKVAVDALVEKGIMKGTSEQTFEPNGQTKRAMLATLLYRLAGEPAVSAEHGFNDVAFGSWYCKAVNWAAGEAIVKGYPDGSFKPNQKLTREQLVTLLYRYSQYKGYDVAARAALNRFSDAAQVSPYALAAMQWAVDGGIVSGTGNAMLMPKGEATRAQLAVIVKRFMEKYGE